MIKNKWLLFPVFFFPFLVGCERGSMSSQNNNRYRQYLVEGKKLYETNCSNCHQADGTGLRKLYPPLTNSDLLKTRPEELPCLIRNGHHQKANIRMPQHAYLTTLEIAEISTYVLSAFAESPHLMTAIAVQDLLARCPTGGEPQK